MLLFVCCCYCCCCVVLDSEIQSKLMLHLQSDGPEGTYDVIIYFALCKIPFLCLFNCFYLFNWALKTSLVLCQRYCHQNSDTITSSSCQPTYCPRTEREGERELPVSLSGEIDQCMSATTDTPSSLFQIKMV